MKYICLFIWLEFNQKHFTPAIWWEVTGECPGESDDHLQSAGKPSIQQPGEEASISRTLAHKWSDYLILSSSLLVLVQVWVSLLKLLADYSWHITTFQGKKIKSELAALVRDMPRVFDKLAKKSKGLEEAVQYYSAFVDFIMNRWVSVTMIKGSLVQDP